MENVNFSLSQQLGKRLQEQKLKIVLAESCTGGGLAEEITAVSGSSAWLDRGFVVYSNQAKIELLDVNATTLERFGAVSEEVAAEMAQGALAHSHANMAISVSGIAGPGGGTEEKPVGLVCFGLAQKSTQACARSAHFAGGRKQVRVDAICFALKWLLESINKK